METSSSSCLTLSEDSPPKCLVAWIFSATNISTQENAFSCTVPWISLWWHECEFEWCAEFWVWISLKEGHWISGHWISLGKSPHFTSLSLCCTALLPSFPCLNSLDNKEFLTEAVVVGWVQAVFSDLSFILNSATYGMGDLGKWNIIFVRWE